MTRNRLPKGKGWFIWVIKQTLGGIPSALAETAKAAGVGHLFFHIHDGYLNETQVPGGMDLRPFIQAANNVGIECWGWGAVYRSTWSQGADRVIEAFKKHPELIGYILDAEAPIKGSPAEAMAIMNKIRYHLPDIPIGLSSYRYPNLHPDLPWKEFRAKCDFDIPQIYWEQCFGDTCGSYQLEASYKIFQNMDIKLPFVPTGPMYTAGSWKPSIKQIQGFIAKARELNLSGVNFWVLYQAIRDHLDLYKYYGGYLWETNESPDVPLTLEEKVLKMWDHHPELW